MLQIFFDVFSILQLNNFLDTSHLEKNKKRKLYVSSYCRSFLTLAIVSELKHMLTRQASQLRSLNVRTQAITKWFCRMRPVRLQPASKSRLLVRKNNLKKDIPKYLPTGFVLLFSPVKSKWKVNKTCLQTFLILRKHPWYQRWVVIGALWLGNHQSTMEVHQY